MDNDVSSYKKKVNEITNSEREGKNIETAIALWVREHVPPFPFLIW
jgi:serine protease inhibitor